MSWHDVERVILKHIGKESNKVLQGILGQILNFIKQSDDGKQVDKIHMALTYIGALPCSSRAFLSTPKVIPFIDKLKKDKNIKTLFDSKLLKEMREQKDLIFKSPKQTLSEEAQKILKEIYSAIGNEYKLAWFYDYEPHALNKALSDGWDNKCDEAMSDFTRDIKIAGISANDEYEMSLNELSEEEKKEQATKRMKKLIDQVSGYEDLHTNKDKLEQWIRNNGGQAISICLLDYLCRNAKHFSTEEIFPLNSPTIRSANWMVENGKLMLDMEIKIPGFSYLYTENYLIGNKHLNDGIEYITKDTGGHDRADSLIKDLIAQQTKGEVVPTIMDIKSKIGLEIDKAGKVVPWMCECKVVSHTDKLLSPERLPQLKDEIKENISNLKI